MNQTQTAPPDHLSETALAQIADRLNTLTDAVVFAIEYPGWISGTCEEGAQWAIGDANDDLSADYYPSDDQSNGPLFSLSVPLTHDPIAMADALFALLSDDDAIDTARGL